jgi:hypothetical protein
MSLKKKIFDHDFCQAREGSEVWSVGWRKERRSHIEGIVLLYHKSKSEVQYHFIPRLSFLWVLSLVKLGIFKALFLLEQELRELRGCS